MQFPGDGTGSGTTMKDKLLEIERRFERLTIDLTDPEVLANAEKYRKLAKERASLEPLVNTFRDLRKVEDDIAGNEALLAEKDEEIRAMAKEELPALRERQEQLDRELKILLLPKDPADDKNVILEIRQGVGGDEAGLFAAELLRMYLRYAERKGWRYEIMSRSDAGAGGLKEAQVLIQADGAYSWLKYEAGVHRVQRVPETEAQGRIHTSTATVAVLPEADEIDIQISEKDYRKDVMRAGGPGGQSVNTTDSAVRLTHYATGIVIHCQDEKSQIKNYSKALKLLRAKLYELELEKQRAERDASRQGMVGSGDRSEKIRTYNFPQDRLTDHRIGLTRHNLPAVMDGDIEDVLVACRNHFMAEQLKRETERSQALPTARA
jgi:peptide chain release factor 1